MGIVFTSGALHARNGGTKLYNVTVQLLNAHGYDACIATQDGSYARWLVNQQPVISYADLKAKNPAKLVIAWLAAPGLERFSREYPLYYYDAELRWTLQFRATLDRLLDAGRLAGIATNNRYIRAWYMATYGITPTLIREWSDTSIFYPDDTERVPGRIGCMPDDPGSQGVYERLRAEFGDRVIVVRGDEQQVADTMRTVDIFAGLNPGKHKLWGEGCPRTQQEAMHCGCVLVAYDVMGNQEYLYDGWTGRLVERGDQEGFVETITYLLGHPEEKEQLRRRGIDLVRALFSDQGKLDLMKRWLEL